MKNVEMQNDIRKILSNPSEVQQTTINKTKYQNIDCFINTWHLKFLKMAVIEAKFNNKM